MKAFFRERWFLLALLLVLVVGIECASFWQPIADWKWLRDGVVALVMFCMSLPLEVRTMLRSLRRPGPPLLAFTITFGVLPLVAWAVSLLLRGDLGPGLQVAAATPCTLASASVWTRRAGGNDAVSILVTLLTNSLCFVLTPLWLLIMTGSVADNPDISLTKMTTMLAVLVVVPILVAQLLRLQPAVRAWSSHQTTQLGVVAQLGILSMIFLGAIRTGLKLDEQSSTVGVSDLLFMVGAVLGVHVAMFWLGVTLGKLFRFSREDRIAVGFAGSQKTLTVGLLMAMTLNVSILPMVAYHCLQLFVDTLIADAYRKGSQEAA